MFLPPDLAWSPTGDALYTIYADGGTSRVARVSLDGQIDTAVGGPVGWFAFDVATADGRLAAIGSGPDDPGELVITEPGGGAPRTITEVSRQWRSGIEFGRLERIDVKAPDGQSLEAWIQHPASRAAMERLPLVLHVHGGPHWPIGVRFGMEFRRLAEQGYRVLYMNPRGSGGYGNAYAQANVGDWGGIDARDLLAAVDAASGRPDVDPDRLAVTGESYGGFMTGWLLATTDRFRAGVAQNGISDLRSEFLTTADPPSFAWDMGGMPWERPDQYQRLSPLTWVEGIRAPLLLIHSEQDQNCPISQSEQLYTALRLLGRETEFLRLPGEGHLVNLVGRPSSRLARIEATDRFLARHLRG
jgi:dipeptidyl aminopeptidase/acylaminoacyl peptidase